MARWIRCWILSWFALEALPAVVLALPGAIKNGGTRRAGRSHMLGAASARAAGLRFVDDVHKRCPLSSLATAMFTLTTVLVRGGLTSMKCIFVFLVAAASVVGVPSRAVNGSSLRIERGGWGWAALRVCNKRVADLQA